jgi:hypothetical protein
MPPIYIDCPRCGWELKLDGDQAGQRVSCPKCKESFVADVGGTYDLAASTGPPPAEAADDPWSPASTPGRLGSSRQQDEPEPEPIDPELEDLFDRWAEE